jgi:hypothetical protein
MLGGADRCDISEVFGRRPSQILCRRVCDALPLPVLARRVSTFSIALQHLEKGSLPEHLLEVSLRCISESSLFSA